MLQRESEQRRNFHVQIGYVIPSLNSAKIKNKQIRWSATMFRFGRQTFDRGAAVNSL